MNVSPEEQEAAWEVIEWIFQPDIQARWNLAMGTAPATFSALQNPDYYQEVDENILRWADMYTGGEHVQNSIPWPMPAWVTDLPTDAYNYSAELIRGNIGLEEYITEFGRRVDVHIQHLSARKK